MTNGLQQYFPMIRTKKEVLSDIHSSKTMSAVFSDWEREQREEFLDFCTGARGVKLLYDSFLRRLSTRIQRRKDWKKFSR